MENNFDDVYKLLVRAQEEDNQMLINVLAQDLANKMISFDSNLDYNELLIRYGYRNINLKEEVEKIYERISERRR